MNDDKEKLTALLKPFDPKKMQCHAIDVQVGNVRNNSLEYIKAVERFLKLRPRKRKKIP